MNVEQSATAEVERTPRQSLLELRGHADGYAADVRNAAGECRRAAKLLAGDPQGVALAAVWLRVAGALDEAHVSLLRVSHTAAVGAREAP